MAQLSVQLRAEIKDLERKLKKAQKDLIVTGNVAEKSAQKVAKTGKTAAAGFKQVGKGAANANPALQEFSRVVQDAPFGIQGVGNNVQQLTANFGNLSLKAGGSTKALKLMFGALAGPGGILLAVSAITSLLTVYSSKLKFATSATKELAKATAEFVGAANLEINTIRTLVGIAASATNSYKARQGALDELNKKYGDYLDNLEIEELNSDSARVAVDKLTKSILQQAKVRGVQKLIEERLADSSEDLSEALVKQKIAQKAVEEEVINLNKTYGLGIDLAEGFGTATRKTFEALNKLGGKKGGIGDTLQFVVNAYSEASDDIKEITREIETDIKPLNNILSSLKIGELLLNADDLGDGVTVIGKKLESKFKNTFRNLDDIFGINEATQNSLDKLKPKFNDFRVTFNKFGDIVGFALKRGKDRAVAEFTDMELALDEFNANITNIMQSGLANAFAGFGEAIGTALVNGGDVFAAVGQSIISSMGKFLSEMGAALIQYGLLAKAKGALDIAIATGGPVAIAAGAAAVALGSALVVAGAALSAIASGGFGSSSVGGQGSSNQTFSSGSGSFGSSVGFGEVVFRISGQELVGVLSRVTNKNSRFGALNG